MSVNKKRQKKYHIQQVFPDFSSTVPFKRHTVHTGACRSTRQSISLIKENRARNKP